MERRILRLKERKEQARKVLERISLPVYSGVDEKVAQLVGNLALDDEPKQVSCRPGCAACCYQIVVVTSGEALTLARHIIDAWAKDDVTKLLETLRRESETLFTLDRERWFEKNIPCVFLRRGVLPRGAVPDGIKVDSKWHGHCRLYTQRPVACRTYAVVSDPQLCTGDQPGAIVSALNTREIENKASQILQDGGAMVLTRRWTAPLQPAVYWCLNWILEGRWPPNSEINKWLRRMVEWSQTDQGGVAPVAEEPQAAHP